MNRGVTNICYLADEALGSLEKSAEKSSPTQDWIEELPDLSEPLAEDS